MMRLSNLQTAGLCRELALLLKGCTRSEIARELFVSGDTVKTHIRNLYRKTGVTGKDELVQAIGGRGLV